MAESMSRWALLPALVSVAIWIGISSVAANAVHVWAKAEFALRSVGSVSGAVLVATLAWSAAVSLWMRVVVDIPLKSLAICVIALTGWVVVVLGVAAVGDELLAHLGPWAVSAWVLEAVIAVLIVFWLLPPTVIISRKIQGAVAAIAWLAAGKALLLLIAPGVVIRL